MAAISHALVGPELQWPADRALCSCHGMCWCGCRSGQQGQDAVDGGQQPSSPVQRFHKSRVLHPQKRQFGPLGDIPGEW